MLGMDLKTELQLYQQDNGYLRYGVWQGLVSKMGDIDDPEVIERLAKFGIEFILAGGKVTTEDGGETAGNYL